METIRLVAEENVSREIQGAKGNMDMNLFLTFLLIVSLTG